MTGQITPVQFIPTPTSRPPSISLDFLERSEAKRKFFSAVEKAKIIGKGIVQAEKQWG